MEYMTDSGGGEMDQTQNGDVVIGPQPDPNLGVQDTEMEEDEARSEATFRFVVTQFSKLKVSKIQVYFFLLHFQHLKLLYISNVLNIFPNVNNHFYFNN